LDCRGLFNFNTAEGIHNKFEYTASLIFFPSYSLAARFCLIKPFGIKKDTTHTFDNYWPKYLVLIRFRNISRLTVLMHNLWRLHEAI